MIKILKFGGTSLASASRMMQVADIVKTVKGTKLVVLSAISGTTSSLVKIAKLHQEGASEKALNKLDELREKEYDPYIKGLFQEYHTQKEVRLIANNYFKIVKDIISLPPDARSLKKIIVQGEMLSSYFFNLYFGVSSGKHKLIDAMDYMIMDDCREPDYDQIGKDLRPLMDKKTETFITQGFICKDQYGNIDNLNRGGSDYSATIIGAVLNAVEVQIWTDIDGMHNNDPRFVKNTNPISRLSYDEAGELAYFGAKILHPTCIIPAQQYNIPVRIKNTMNPKAEGTVITHERNPDGVKSIAAKSEITAIKIKSSRMIMAYGFLRKIFEVFEQYKTSIDMITTSEIAVSLTIDDPLHLKSIVNDIKKFGLVEVDMNQTIICIVGDMIAEKKGVGQLIFKALREIPIRMIAYGGSKNNISILVDSQHKTYSLNALNQHLFN